MNELAKQGRNKALSIFLSVVLISIYTIVTYNILAENIETKKITQQIVRFLLTLVLIYSVMKGKNWAIISMSILLSLGILLSLIALLAIGTAPGMIPLLVTIYIYSMAIYHLNFTKSFKAYLNYLKEKS